MGSESSDSDSEAWVAYRAPGQTSSPRERTRRVSLPLAPSRDVGLLLDAAALRPFSRHTTHPLPLPRRRAASAPAGRGRG